MPLSWRALRDLKLQDLSIRRSPLEMRKSIGPSRKLKGDNKRSTMEVLQ